MTIFFARWFDGGATRPLRGMEKFHGDPTVGPRLNSGPEVKNGRSSAKDSLDCSI